MTSPSFFTRLKRGFQLYRAASKHPRTPLMAKVLPWLSILYILWPLDVVPDIFPILGQLDDIAVIPLLFYLALQLIPKDIKSEVKNVIDVDGRPSM